jgi:exosome complex component RRP45
MSHRPTEASIEIGRVIERGLRESRAIDTEALCVVAGIKVWSVRCDIHIIDHGGNILDCASIATIAALLHFRRPTTSVIDNKVTIIPIEDKEPLPLSIHHIPVAISFALFEEGQIIIVDPSLKEELVMEGRITFTLNSHREICAVQKSGGIPLSLDQIIQCSRIAAVKAEEITQLIQSSLKQQSSNDSKKNPASLDNNKP